MQWQRPKLFNIKGNRVMSTKVVLVKLSSLGFLIASLVACSSIFPDQRDAYKKATELRPLEVPPGLSKQSIRNEQPGQANRAISSQAALVKVEALPDPDADVLIIQTGQGRHLVVRDSLRSTWRKTVSALEELEYDIEDKNRENGLIYLDVLTDKKDDGMLASLAFWKNSAVKTYVLTLVADADTVVIQVNDENEKPVDDDIAKKIYTDLLNELKS